MAETVNSVTDDTDSAAPAVESSLNFPVVGIGASAGPNWTGSAAKAWHQVLVPLADPHSLAAAGAFALAAWAVGPILRSRHLALGLVAHVRMLRPRHSQLRFCRPERARGINQSA